MTLLIKELIKQDFLKSIRSTGFYRNVVANVFYGLLGVYILAILLLLGFNLHKVLLESKVSDNPLFQVCGGLFYTMVTGLVFRFMLQSLATFNLPPYQVLNIKRNTLVNFIILKPLFNPLNYFSLLVAVPFSLRYIDVYYGAEESFLFIWIYINIVWFNSMLASFLKRKYSSSFLNTLIVLGCLGVIIMLEYFKIFSLYKVSLAFFGFLVLNPVGWAIAPVFSVMAFCLNKWFFHQNYYAETFNKFVGRTKAIMTDFVILNRLGLEGELMAMELKLILRHKRSKSVLYMAGFFLLYGLLFYPQASYKDSNGLLFFVAIFVTGLAMLMFGQWVVSWDSTHFDGLMTKNIPVRTYVQANYNLLAAFAVISFVLTMPYFLFGWKIMFLHITAFLFNIGVNLFILLYFSSYNTKRIDLSKASAMNYQGVTIKNFLVQVPMLFVPGLFFWMFSSFFSFHVACFILSAIGLLGLLFTRPLIGICAKQLQARKYALAEGFRESE